MFNRRTLEKSTAINGHEATIGHPVRQLPKKNTTSPELGIVGTKDDILSQNNLFPFAAEIF